MEIYADEYLVINYLADEQIVEQIWSTKSAKLTEEKFKDLMLKYLDVIRRKKPKSALLNMKDFRFIITPALQVWIDETINAPGFRAGIKRAVFLQSSDIFVHVSVEQTMSEKYGGNFEVKYFDDIDDAIDWLSNA